MPVERRCTYCLDARPSTAFAHQGDHVIPYSVGGELVDPNVCDDCEDTANRNADQLIVTDSLTRFLRDAYRIRDRGGAPGPCRFSVRVPGAGGVVHVTVTDSGATFEAAMSVSARERLGIGDDPSHETLAELVEQQLGAAAIDPLALAQAARGAAARPTPPEAWSRFMAKLGLAFGREAYGDAWLHGPHAAILSNDLLGAGVPRIRQQAHYPPVEPVWPYRPPKHVAWIDQRDDVAVLMVVLFGQVIGAVPIGNTQPAQGAYTGWIFEPVKRTFYRSSYPAMMLGAAAARLTQEGHDVVAAPDAATPWMFVADGHNGPAELPIPTLRADSPQHALEIVMKTDPELLTAQLRDAARGE
jgi:hypothetical protein